jgi:hypothetical protein
MEAVHANKASAGSQSRFTFLQKPIAAAGFVALADMLFYFHPAGTTLGFFCASLLAFILIMRGDVLRHRSGRSAAGAAALFALVLAYDPSLLGVALFWLMLTLAVLLPRTAGFDDGWRWAKRLGWHWLLAPLGPFGDQRRARAAGRRRRLGLLKYGQVLALPLLGSLVFLSLFASANPLIGRAFERLDVASLFADLSLPRLFFWLVLLVLVWSVLRPRPLLLQGTAGGAERPLPLPSVGLASVTLSLIAFNALFALQNGLDVAFLWSGARLPEGMTLAEYAHRGAYPLIATALLAALFVLLTLQPGSQTAESRLVRKLVYAWIAQNLLLVASTILRTLDYVDAYSLTRLRIAALIWMALVAVGLILICYRIWRSKSRAWLINANLAAVLVALSACSATDLGRMAAAWNVRHAREAGGPGANLDICYLRGLGASALLPMIDLESRTRNPILKERVGWARIAAMDALAARQSDWRGWTVRGALRLSRAREEAERRRLPSAYGGWRACGGPVPIDPLTAGKRR